MASALAIAYYFSHLSGIFGGLILLIVNIRKQIQTRIPFLMVMSIVILDYVVFNVLLLLPNLVPELLDPYGWQVMGGLTIVLLSFNIGLLIFFFESFSGEIRMFRLSLGIVSVTGLSTLFVVSLMMGDFSLMHVPTYRDDVLIYLWTPLSYIFQVPQICMLAYWSSNNLLKSIRATRNFRHRQQMKGMLLGSISTFFLGPLLAFVGDSVVLFGISEEFGFWISEFLGFFFMSAGIAFILLSYVLDSSLLFLQPYRVERLMVIHESGMPLLDYHFNVFPETQKDHLMLSGLLVAIKSVAHEVMGERSTLEFIKFRGMEIMFSIYEQLMFVLVAQKRSDFLTGALQKFSTRFTQFYGGTLASYEVSQNRYLEIVPVLERTFGLKS